MSKTAERSSEALASGGEAPGTGAVTTSTGTAHRTRALLETVAHWLGAIGIMAIAVRPLWGLPAQGDDFLQLLLIDYERDSVLDNAVAHMVNGFMYSSTHLTPLGYLFEGLLKGAMAETTSPVLTASALHSGVILLLMLTTMALSAQLLSRLLEVFGRVSISPGRLAIPVSVGYAITAQISAPWSMYDPLVAHPIFGALPTAVGIAYLAASLGALQKSARGGSTWVGAVLGVAGILIYEIAVVFVAAVVVAAWLGRHRLVRIRRRLPWLVLPAVVALAVSRLILAGNPQSGYGGTALALDLSTVPTWWIANQTSQPGLLWGIASRYVDVGRTGVYAVVGAVLIGAALLWWASRVRRGATTTADTLDGAAAGRAAGPRPSLLVLLPIGALGVLAPIPFVLTETWGTALQSSGTTYMHSLIPLWCWAMGFAVVAVTLARSLVSRRGVAAGLAGLLVVTVWVAVQLSVNRQLSATLEASPFFGLDVLEVLENPVTAPETERCAALAGVRSNPTFEAWVSALNRVYEERHDEAYCASPLEQ